MELLNKCLGSFKVNISARDLEAEEAHFDVFSPHNTIILMDYGFLITLDLPNYSPIIKYLQDSLSHKQYIILYWCSSNARLKKFEL